jgi:DNA-binding MarR family transcriptional regulator
MSAKQATEEGRTTGAEEDWVDRAVRRWATEIPDLDPVTEALVERIGKIHKLLKRSLAETAEEFGLTIEDWELLARLRWLGPPYRLTPGHLADQLSLSPAAMTGRLDRLEKRGLVRRVPDPGDRRSLKVELTEEGVHAWDRTVGVQAVKERLIAGVLSTGEKDVLNDMLRRLLKSLDPDPPAGC